MEGNVQEEKRQIWVDMYVCMYVHGLASLQKP